MSFYKKIFLLAFLNIMAASMFGQNLLEQKVSVQFSDMAIENAIGLLKNKTGVKFTYSPNIFSKNKKVSVNVENMPLKNILEQIFSGTNVGYKATTKKIILFKKEDIGNGATGMNTSPAPPKKKITLSGYVSDKETGEKLIGANIYDAANEQGAVTNVYGYFSLTIPTGKYNFEISYIGYSPQNIAIDLNKDITKNVDLGVSNELAVVEVVATTYREEAVLEGTQMSSINIPIEKIEALPALGGEVDVMRVIQLLPGVQSGGEGSSGVFVRGGSPDQNLILLDGVPVYNVSHLFGFLSVFNSDAINNMELIKGGFLARYGGRLSSVMDIRMKEGNMKKFTGSGSISPIATKLLLEGPIINDKMSFMVTGRRTFLDLILGREKKETSNNVTTTNSSKYFFYDFNGKINYKISDKDRLYLSFYGGKDKFEGKEKYETFDTNGGKNYFSETNNGLDWGNIISAFRWNHLFTDKLFGNLTLHYSRYQFDINNSDRTTFFENNENISDRSASIEYNSFVKDWAAKLDFDYVPSTRHYIRFGASAVTHTFLPGVTGQKNTNSISGVETDTILNNNSKINALEYTAYMEDDFDLTSRLKMNLGVHASAYNVGNKTYTSVQPRASLRYKPTSNWAVKGAFATMTQYLHLLTTSGVGLPTDLWISPTEKIKPQQAWQVAGGVTHTLGKSWDVSLEGYYKEMKNMVAYKEGVNLLVSTEDIEEKVILGKGTSKGAELFLRKNAGKTTGWFGYTLSWTDRTFPEINFGKTYPYKYDRRHDLSISVVHKFSEKFRMSGSWVYSSGQAVTLPRREFNPGTVVTTNETDLSSIYVGLDYTGKNNFRLPSFHRLDISASWHKKTKWGEQTFQVSLYNAYSRKNPFYVSRGLYVDDNGDLEYKYKLVSLFPIIPGVAYNFKF